MKRTNAYTKLIVTALAAVALAVLVNWGLERAGAADHRDRRAFGLISVNPGQDLRLNIFSLTYTARVRRVLVAFDIYAQGAPAAGSPAATGAPGDETFCMNNLRQLRFVGRHSCVVTLEPFGAATLDLPAPPEAVLVRPVVNPNGFDDAHSQIISSLEVREGGRTTHVLNPNMVIYDAQPHR
jgi:hypothetical protein